MARKTITKTVCQYSAGVIAPEVMEKLSAVAAGYSAVKNYVYRRYGGIGSLDKLYPGYTVQNEMTKTGLRQTLGLSGASFYPAIFEALVDIRNQWDREKTLLGQRVRGNANLSEADRHYLRYVLSVDKIFSAVLNHRSPQVSAKFLKHYAELVGRVETRRLDNYLRRQARKLHGRLQVGNTGRFAATPDGYRYADHGIYLATTERRRRVFVPLTDNNCYGRQIEVKLLAEKSALEIYAPIEVKVREHEDYQAQLGLAMGMKVMLTTHEGHTYGEDISAYQEALSNWLRAEHDKYQRNRLANPGRKKYAAEKRRLEEHLHSYINQEINRLLRTEKPERIYIMKFPGGNRRSGARAVNYALGTWQRGYIRKQLRLKCQENNVELVEVFGKGIATECSICGAEGKRSDGVFTCDCGNCVPEKQNVACNAKKRGMENRPSG